MRGDTRRGHTTTLPNPVGAVNQGSGARWVGFGAAFFSL